MEDKILARIRKLLSQAEGEAEQGHTGAADTFNKKAGELIAKYGVDAALLAAAGTQRDEITRTRIGVDNPYSREKAMLLSRIADPLRVQTVHHSCGRSVVAVTLVGFESDIERVNILFTSLLLQAATQVESVHAGYFVGGQSLAAYRRSWLDGFSQAVKRRLIAAEQAAVDDAPGTGTDLVLAGRTSQVTAALGEAFPKLRKARRRSLSGAGTRAGFDAGERANLHQQTGVHGQRRGEITNGT